MGIAVQRANGPRGSYADFIDEHTFLDFRLCWDSHYESSCSGVFLADACWSLRESFPHVEIPHDEP